MSNAIGRARVTAPGTIYTPDVMSDATIELFRVMSSWTTTYPRIPRQAAAPAIETIPAVGRPSPEVLDLARQAGEMVAAVRDMAARADITSGEALEVELDEVCRQTGATTLVGRRAWQDPCAGRPGNPALCPVWCPGDCGDTAERSHVRELVDMHVAEGDLIAGRVELIAQVQVFESPDLPGGIDPAEVYLRIGRFGTEVDVSASLTPDEAERLGHALVEGARLARTGAGRSYRVDVFDGQDVLLTSRDITAEDDRQALAVASGLVHELGGAVLAAVFTTGPAGALLHVDTVRR